MNEGVEGGSSTIPTRFDEAGPTGEQGQQQHEGRVTLAPSATARLSYSPWPVGRTDGRTDERTDGRTDGLRHGTARRSAVWHGTQAER